MGSIVQGSSCWLWSPVYTAVGPPLSTWVEGLPPPDCMRSCQKTLAKGHRQKQRSIGDVLAARPAIPMLKEVPLTCCRKTSSRNNRRESASAKGRKGKSAPATRLLWRLIALSLLWVRYGCHIL